jgi:serine/threonine protein kinase
MPGHILHNRYRVVRELGDGRFCTVWEAVDASDTHYAIKVFKRDDVSCEYFENELFILAQLGQDAPNLVRCVDAFVHLYHAGAPDAQCPPTMLIKRGGSPACAKYMYPCIVFELLGENVFDLLRHVNGDIANGGADGVNDTTGDTSAIEKGMASMNVSGGGSANGSASGSASGSSSEDADDDSEDGSDSGSVSDSEFEPTIGLNLNVVKRIVYQVLIALSHLHHRGFIHTDIKPENILLCKRISEYNDPNEICVKLGDLGSTTPASKLFSRSVGTQEYVAPEIVVHGKYSFPADIWAVGCLIYELLTNESLFDLSGVESDDTDYETESSSGGDGDSDDDDGGDDGKNGGKNGRNGKNGKDVDSGDDDSDDSDESADTRDNIEFITHLHHLLLMECVLGRMPKKAVHGRDYNRYFTKRGEIKNILGIDPPSPITIRELLANYDLNPTVADEASNLIEACLRYRPSERITAEQALMHPFLRM